MEINIQHVSMTYPNGKQALKDLDLDLKAPSLVGLLGPNGRGKVHPDEAAGGGPHAHGRRHPGGRPAPGQERPGPEGKAGLPAQDFGLFDELTVKQFLDYMAALKGVQEPKAAIQRVIQAVNLEEKARAKIRTLSGGQRQRVGISQALLGTRPS